MTRSRKIFLIIGGIIGFIMVMNILAVLFPRKIAPEDCDFVAKDRAAKAVMVEEQHPEMFEKKGNFEGYYNAFYQICIKGGI